MSYFSSVLRKALREPKGGKMGFQESITNKPVYVGGFVAAKNAPLWAKQFLETGYIAPASKQDSEVEEHAISAWEGEGGASL